MTAIVRRRYATDLVTHLVGREFRLRYRRSLLGWTWAVAQPLARLAILTFLFTQVLPLGIANYPVFLFTGLLVWNWFQTGVSSATSSAIDRRDLLFRPGVPRAAVPVVTVFTDALDLFAALPVLVVFLVLDGGIPLTALFFPVILGLELLLILGIGFALCTANVYLRDVQLLLQLALLLGFYLTPVFYSGESVPARFDLLISLNPVARLLAAARDVLVEGQLPEAGPFLVLTAVCGLVFITGYAIYRHASPKFVDEL